MVATTERRTTDVSCTECSASWKSYSPTKDGRNSVTKQQQYICSRPTGTVYLDWYGLPAEATPREERYAYYQQCQRSHFSSGRFDYDCGQRPGLTACWAHSRRGGRAFWEITPAAGVSTERTKQQARKKIDVLLELRGWKLVLIE